MEYLGTSEYAAGSNGSRSSVFFFLALASIIAGFITHNSMQVHEVQYTMQNSLLLTTLQYSSKYFYACTVSNLSLRAWGRLFEARLA